MRMLGIVVALVAALSAAAPSAAAQAPEAPPAVERAEPGVSAAAPSGLPQRYAPPRTLRAYWHVFIAFGLAWLLLFGYTVALGRRFARLERELEALRG